MFGRPPQSAPRSAAALVTGLTILALGAMAAAIPPARLTPGVTGVERGYLVGGASFSDMMAELLNGNGYTYMAIDLTRAKLRAGEIWRVQFDEVSRIFPVWGWIDVRGGTGQARNVAASLPLSGLFLFGAKPEDADAVRAAKPGLRVVRVVTEFEAVPKSSVVGPGRGTTGPVYGDHAVEMAVTLSPEQFAEKAGQVHLPVLLADLLDEAAIDAARAKAPGDYLVCSVPILD